jgi:hypothetical protein
MKYLVHLCTTALDRVGAFVTALNPNLSVLLRASLCIAAFLAGSAPLSAGTLSVYVASGAGSFYDHQDFTFKDKPSDTDFVCASHNPPGPWTQGGRPCDFILWKDIPADQSIATCNTSDGKCHNQNGGIELYVLKSAITATTTTPPVTPPPPVVAPPASGDGTATINWAAATIDVDKKPITPAGYNLYWGTNPASLTKISLPVTPLSYTLSNLASGTYYFAMTTQVGLVESDRTNLASKVVTTSSTPPVIPPTTSVYHVKAITTGTRPATEAVLPTTGTALVLGYKLGDIAVGKPCADTAVIKSGSTEYHAVSESDTVLLSPTYKGRLIVAVCGK